MYCIFSGMRGCLQTRGKIWTEKGTISRKNVCSHLLIVSPFLAIQVQQNALLGSSWEAWRSYVLFCNSDASVELYSFLWHESQIIVIIQRTSLLAFLSDYFLLLSFWCFWQTYLIGPGPFKWNMNKSSPRIMRLDVSNRKNILEEARRYPW